MMTSQRIQYGGRPPYLKSSFGYISTNNYPINAKFCRINQNRPYDQNTEFRKFKMADGRHFENSFIAISQPEIIRFQRNLVCRWGRKRIYVLWQQFYPMRRLRRWYIPACRGQRGPAGRASPQAGAGLRAGARRRRRRPAARIAAAVYVSPELYSLPVSQEFASLRPPLGGRSRLV